ncbi:hypothetical protein KJ836_01090 [Patescibacteria group bacterium]|nr:hypothetical protein [Patescibacteria group bacterium]
MAKAIILAIAQYAQRFFYASLLKISIIMSLLPVAFISTEWFGGRLPMWFSYLLMWFSKGKEYAGVEEVVSAVFLVVFVLWVFEEVIRYIAHKYFHKTYLGNSGYNLKVWFWVVTGIYIVGSFAAPDIGAAAFWILLIGYIAAIVPLGICWFMDFTSKYIKV